MSKKSILIIIKNQFGYHTDYTKYCEYLNSEFNITYLCFDAGYEKLVMKSKKKVSFEFQIKSKTDLSFYKTQPYLSNLLHQLDFETFLLGKRYTSLFQFHRS